MAEYSLEDWVNLLDNYLERADLSIENKDVDAREEIRNKFLLFIQGTPQKYEFLDDIARRIINELIEYDLNLAIENISKIAGKLKKQRAILNLANQKAKEYANEIQLENFKNAIDDISEKMGSIKETSEILNDKEKSFDDKISKLKTLIDDFKI